MRRLALVLAMALAIPVLAQAASNPVLAAVKRTATAKSSTFRMSMTTSVAGQRMVLSGSGAQSGSSARLSMRTSGLGGAVRMDAVLVTEHGAYVMYLRSPAFSSQLPRGKSWLRVDLSKQLSNMGVNFSALLSASQTFKPLEKGLVSTTRLGRDVVAGQTATRYRAVLDVKRAARALPGYRQQIAAVERATGITFRRLRYDLWVAGDGRIHRLRYSMPIATSGVRGRSVQTMTFLSFDKPVTITAPPRSQVFSP
jgi:hypothetical protein